MPAIVRQLLPFFLIIAVGALCYANTLYVPFVLDDVTSILVNPQISAFTLSLKPRMLAELSFALNYTLHGLSLPGYHFTNIALHLANAILLYTFVLTIFRTPLFKEISFGRGDRHIALAAALIFVAHPLQTAAVTYLAQRVALMAAFLYLSAVILYLKSRLSHKSVNSVAFLILSMVSATAAILSKENAVTVPLAILFTEATFFWGESKRRYLLSALYLLPLVAAVLLTNRAIFFQPDLSATLINLTAERGAPPRLDYLLTQFPVLLDYLRLFFFPAGLNLDHDVTLRSSIADPGVISSFLFLVVIVLSALRLWIEGRKGESLINRLCLLSGFGVGWFFIAISLESSLIPVRDVMFDHRVYLPSFGLVTAVTAALWFLVAGWKDSETVARRFSVTIWMLVLTLSITTIFRNRVWQSEVTLWEDAVSKSPVKGRPHGALGHAYQRAGRTDEAVKAYRDAVRFSPGDSIAGNNLGSIFLTRKRYAEAIDEFEKVIKLSPSTAAAHFNLGLAYAALGRLAAARESFTEAVRVKPDYREARENLAVLNKVMER